MIEFIALLALKVKGHGRNHVEAPRSLFRRNQVIIQDADSE